LAYVAVVSKNKISFFVWQSSRRRLRAEDRLTSTRHCPNTDIKLANCNYST